MIGSLCLRPITADDAEFLFDVYANTRYDELAPLGWPTEQVEAFLRQQFHAQHTYYVQHFADASFDVIEIEGEPVGRLYVDRGPDEIRIIDIALLPSHRGEGLGGHLLAELLAEAAATGRTVGIHVEKTNPALRLYHRLGFRVVEDRGVYWFLEWRPPVEAGPVASSEASDRAERGAP